VAGTANTFANRKVESDEILITPTERPATTIQVQGCDRKYPAIVIRKSTSVDPKRSTILTISGKRGKHTASYGLYANTIAEYVKRKQSRNGTVGTNSTDNRGEPGSGWNVLANENEGRPVPSDCVAAGEVDCWHGVEA